MDKPTAKDLPKLKTQLPDPLMMIQFGITPDKQVFIRLSYSASPENIIYQGVVYHPESLAWGLEQAMKASRG